MDQKHSGLGIASFVISILSGISMLLLIGAAGVLEINTPGGLDEESTEAVLIGLGLFAFLFVSLVALGLGIAGLFQKDRNKVFAILGSVFAAMTIGGTLLLIGVGLAMG